MSERGLTAAETARRMRDYLPVGDKASRSTICQYKAARALPRLRYLDALSMALGVNKSDLLPSLETDATGNCVEQDRRRRAERMNRATDDTDADAEASGSPENSVPLCTIEDLGDEVHLRINQRVSWAAALTILRVLKTDDAQ
jgi:transcriptional regulator with XRE-family HTH domain